MVFLANITFTAVGWATYAPPVIGYVLAELAVAFLVYRAWRSQTPQAPAGKVASIAGKRSLFGVGFLGAILLFLTVWSLPNTGITPLVPFVLEFAYLFIFQRWIWRLSGFGAWGDGHQLALASDGLLFLILLVFVREATPHPSDNPAGQAWVSVGFSLFLIWIGWRIKRRGK